MEWDPNHETVLASSGEDRRLMVWDLNRYLNLKKVEFNLTIDSTFSKFLFNWGLQGWRRTA